MEPNQEAMCGPTTNDLVSCTKSQAAPTCLWTCKYPAVLRLVGMCTLKKKRFLFKTLKKALLTFSSNDVN